MDRKLTLYHCIRCHLLWHQLITDVDVGPIPNIEQETTKAEVQSNREAPLESLCNECREVGWQVIEYVNSTQ